MRIRISKRNSELVDSLTKLYNFRFEGIISRIAFAYSLQLGRRFDMHSEEQIASDGKDWRDERAIFGETERRPGRGTVGVIEGSEPLVVDPRRDDGDRRHHTAEDPLRLANGVPTRAHDQRRPREDPAQCLARAGQTTGHGDLGAVEHDAVRQLERRPHPPDR